jgi:hypothetical protein
LLLLQKSFSKELEDHAEVHKLIAKLEQDIIKAAKKFSDRAKTKQ